MEFVLITFSSAGVLVTFMHNRNRDQPEPVHLHWQIHSSVISSTWPYENNPCFDLGILVLWKRGSQYTSGHWHANSHSWNGLVR